MMLINRPLDKTQENKALAEAKTIEEKKVAEGHRYVRISNLHRILVPCNKNGEPTKEGKRIIERYKKNLFI